MADTKPHSEDLDDSDLESENGPCKWGPIKPSCCQRFRNPKCVLFWLCWAGALQGLVVSGFVNVVITTIERRFEISSTETGTIVSCYDIASAICLLPVSYFGGLGVKPRYIGIGVLTLGLGSFLFSLPHFTTGLYISDADRDSLCDNSQANVTCDQNDVVYGGISNYKYLFILAQLLHGAGASPYYTLGVAYLDENVPPQSSALYNGIFYSMVILGTATGYLAGGEFLNIWTDFDTVDTSNLHLTSDNRRWVGAWWLGFVFSGCIAVFTAIPLSGFPRRLPGFQRYKKEREASTDHVTKNNRGAYVKTNPDSNDGVKDGGNKDGDKKSRKLLFSNMWKSTKTLITNPTFMFLNLVGATEAAIVGGFSSFMPKFLEYQFSLPASRAAQFVGLAAIPAGGGGTFLGGYLVKRFDLKVPGILKCCILSSVTVVLMAFIFFVHCDNVPFAGININYLNKTSSISTTFLGKQLDNQCNAGCGCQEEDYHPVCGRDGVMYFSPCYAGCQSSQSGDTTRYSNCSCISSTATDYEAEFTSCESPCNLLPIFLSVFAIMMFLTFLVSMPSLHATLRCVPDDQRSFALGIQWLMVRCLGAIPGPIVFGKMIDMACLLWQTRCDGDGDGVGDQGSCFFYDNKNMSYYLMAIGMAVKSLSTLFFVLAYMFYKSPPASEKHLEMNVDKPRTYTSGVDNPVFDDKDEIFTIEPSSKSVINDCSHTLV